MDTPNTIDVAAIKQAAADVGHAGPIEQEATQ
jgi:hypothetical protein